MAFRHIQYFGQTGPLKQIEHNLVWYLRSQLLDVGAYYNIPTGTVGYDDNDLSLLKPSYQPEHSNFQFWKGHSHQWVWESGLNPMYTPTGPPPIQVSGVYISGTFYPENGGGAYDHYIDYNRGGVVFTDPQPTGLQVYCERTERAVFVYPYESDEYNKLTYEYLRGRSFVPGSGLDNYSPEYSAFLPAVFVEVGLKDTTPYAIGSVSKFNDYRVNFHIFAEHTDNFAVLRDICYGLENNAFTMFDVNQVISNDDMPLDYLGRLDDDPKIRADLSSRYPWKKGFFLETATDMVLPDLLPVNRAKVSIDFQVVM